MPRIRTIKPEFWAHEGLSELPEATHMLAGALLNYADDEGYFNANPALIRAACSPLREPSVSIHESLTRLAKIDFVRLGSTPDGRKYGFIVHFAEHQRVNRPTPSKIKDLPVVWESSLSAHGGLTEDSLLEGKGKEQGKEQGTGKRASARPGEADLVFHPSLPTSEWQEWITFRRSKRMPCDEITLRKQLAILAPHDTATQREMINNSIQSGWQGLFPPKHPAGVRRPPVRLKTIEELEAEEAARAAG